MPSPKPPKQPPRFVPTLTEVVQGRAPAPPSDAPDSQFRQEQVVQRVLQRVDSVLDRRLREAIAETVIEHTRAIEPALRERIELVVRETVAEAFEQEQTPRG